MSRDAKLLVDALRDPAIASDLDVQGWTELLSMARAEQLLGTLAERLKIESVPPKVAEILAEARVNADYQRRSALWEADCARRALAGYGGKVVLLKGTAYVAAGLRAGEGRLIGDLDILVARDDLPQVEAALLAAGWEWVKPDPYDDAYYRDHMHELPPLIHKERDRMIDVHHTVLPLTARPTPDAAGMLGASIPLPPAGGVRGGGEQSEPYGISGPPPAHPQAGGGDYTFSLPPTWSATVPRTCLPMANWMGACAIFGIFIACSANFRAPISGCNCDRALRCTSFPNPSNAPFGWRTSCMEPKFRRSGRAGTGRINGMWRG